MPLLSIVIPVYNVENYLDRCLHSILSQSFIDYEVILVDNASTDGSGEICDLYGGKYANFNVIHVPHNILPAGARNAGLRHATGRYVHFCDSDDYYADESFSKMAKVLQEASPSVMMGQFICNPEKGSFFSYDVKLDPDVFEQCDADKMSDYLLRLPNLLCTPWRIIVNREFLTSNKLYFLEGFHAEDEEWFPKVICAADTFALLAEPFYHYCPRATGSVTSSKTYLNSKSQLVVAFRLLRFLNEQGYTDKRRELLASRALFLTGLFNTRCDTFDSEQLQELGAIIAGNSEILPMLKTASHVNVLPDYISKYGAERGLVRYQAFIIEQTISLVQNKRNMDIYVFPTGYSGEGTARILLAAGFRVKGFLDNSPTKTGYEFAGLQVYLPLILKELPADKLKNIFVVVSIQKENTAATLMKQLCELGLHESQYCSRVY